MSLRELWEKDQKEQSGIALEANSEAAIERQRRERAETIRSQELAQQKEKLIQAREELWQKSGIEEIFKEAAEIINGEHEVIKPNSESPYNRNLALKWIIKKPAKGLLNKLLPAYDEYYIGACVEPDNILLQGIKISHDDALNRNFVEKVMIKVLKEAIPVDYSSSVYNATPDH